MHPLSPPIDALASHTSYFSPFELPRSAAFVQLPFCELEPDVLESALRVGEIYGFLPRRLQPCQHGHDLFAPVHRPFPLPPQAIAACAATAAQISGMPLDPLPKVCQTDFDDFNISSAVGRHYSYLNFMFDRELQHKPGVQAVAVQHALAGAMAVCLPQSHTIIFNPGVCKALSLFGDDWPLRSVLVHEMAHAAQFQAYPELAELAASLAQQNVINAGAVRPNLASIRESRAKAQALGKAFLPMQLLLEGHATWVQRIDGERVQKASTAWTHRLGYAVYGANLKLAEWMPSPNVYTAGHNMICAVETLQQDLEKGPFVNAAGETVTLDPKLRGHGLVGLLFANPEMVTGLLPHYSTGWRRAVRERADVAPLRRFVLSLPGHVPLALS